MNNWSTPTVENQIAPSSEVRVGLRAADRCQLAMPPISRIQHGRVAVLALLGLAAIALPASLHMPTGSAANVGLGNGVTYAEPLDVGTALQPEPVSSPAAKIRYDIPGWDSIRRTAAAPDVSRVEAAMQVAPTPLQGPEYLLLPVLFGLLPPAFSWVGLPLALRCIAWWAYASACGNEGKPGQLLIAFSEMAEQRTYIDADDGASDGPSTGGCAADLKGGARASVLLRLAGLGDITLMPGVETLSQQPSQFPPVVSSQQEYRSR